MTLETNTASIPENYFLKLSNGEYVQYHREPVTNQEKVSVGRITPTRVKTYGGTDPAFIWNTQAIRYTASGVDLFKDYNNNCFIDIYESLINPNKCRIVGINGRNVHIGSSCFSIYEVSTKEKSFVTNENRLIFVDISGTYIVSTQQNPIDDVVSTYEKDGKFSFKGSVIKFSSIYGNRLINDQPITSDDFFDSDSSSQCRSPQNSNKKPTGIFSLNCSHKTPIFIGTNFAPVTKLYPAMQQIEQISGVKLTSPPPSEQSVIKRISDILGLGMMSDLLAVKNGRIYFVDITPAALRGEIPGIVWSLADATLFYSYAYPLHNFIPMTDQGIQWTNYIQACSNIDLLVKNGVLKEYILDMSAEAKENRRQIAAQIWENI